MPSVMAADSKLQGALELMQATILRQVYSERQLFEVMVDFWSNHFNIYIFKNQCRILKTWDDREVIRKHALGNFAICCLRRAESGDADFSGQCDEHQGRAARELCAELMELHTLGVDGGYTSEDVKEVARAFTGWSLVTPGRVAVDFQL